MNATSEDKGYFLASREFLNVAELIGYLGWITFCTLRWNPEEDEFFIAALLLVPPLLLVPRLLCIARVLGQEQFPLSLLTRVIQVLSLPAALSLAVAYLRDNHSFGLVLALPWALLTVLLALWGLVWLLGQRNWARLANWGVAAGFGYVVVGAVWILCNRGGISPMEFDPILVFLAAVHFSHSGFILPVIAGLAAGHVGGWFSAAIVLAVVVGVPAVATGIVVTHLTGNLTLEALAAVLLVLGAIGVAYLHLALFGAPHLPAAVRWLFLLASVAGGAAAVLALLYALRGYVTLPWLSVGTMTKTHGVLNALFFELPALLGWSMVYRAHNTEAETRGRQYFL